MALMFGSAPKRRLLLMHVALTLLGAETLVADALHRSPDAVEEWRTDLPGGRQVVSYCFQGREVSQQGVAAAPRLMGIEANFLEGHSIIRPDRDRAVAMSPS